MIIEPLIRKITPIAALLFILTASVALLSQPDNPQPPVAPATPLTFDVVAIKPHDPTVRPNAWTLQPTADGYTAANVSLLQLVRQAYGIYDPKLITGGPPWIDKDKFDLEAKFDPSEIPNAKDLTFRQRMDMLRPVLADRFHLKVHFETKDFPVYNLVIAKGGPKFQQAPPEHLIKTPGGQIGLLTRTACEGCGLDGLLLNLQSASGRTVIDKTGLTGRYDYPRPLYSNEYTQANSPDAAYPSIFTAVQEQLGLKLEPSTAPLDILVIDSAEMPTPS
jgi:uncharacterized protein (TIGR03435 family)